MADKILREISEMMYDPDVLRNDMAEATEMVRNMFQEKYVHRFQKAVKNRHAQIQNNPPREIKLLHALKEFAPEHAKESYDKMIDAYLFINSAKSMQKEFSTLNPQRATKANSVAAASLCESNADDSIHSDGVYDVDQACVTKKRNNAPLLMTALVMSMMK